MMTTATGKGHTWDNSTATPPAEMIPMLLVVPKIVDWSGGVTLLGLGDVVLPGLLVAFALRVDVIKSLLSAPHPAPSPTPFPSFSVSLFTVRQRCHLAACQASR